MVKGLAVSDLVNVQVTLEPTAVPLRNFGMPLFADSTQGVIDIEERIRLYSTIEQVSEDWGTQSGLYKAAVAFFSQSPQPDGMYAGFWARSATKGLLHGGLLTPSQQLLSNFTAITSGAFFAYIDGVPKTISGINWGAAVNINGVASTLQTQLQAQAANATATWNATLGRFELASGTTGAGSSITGVQEPTAFGSIAFAGQPANNDNVTIKGTAITFVTGTPTTNQVQIGASLTVTLDSLVTLINASADVNLSAVTALRSGTTVYVVSKATGTGGNAYTLAKTGTNITVSGATFSGGSGTDASAVLGLRAQDSADSVAGVDAETALQAAQVFAEMSNDWYMLEFVDTTAISDADHQAVGAYIEACNPSRVYFYTTQDENALVSNDSSDIGSAMKTLNLARSCGQYSSSSLVAAASLFGRNSTVNYAANNSVINLMWKRQPGITAEVITASQAAALKAKHLNVFVKYQNDKAIIQYGVMANGDYIDERIGLDWFQNFVQTTLWNVLYQTPTKIPQTDAGQQLLITPVKQCCAAAVNNGLVAPGLWTGPEFGQLKTNDQLQLGYYVWSDVYANQSPADRAARKAMPILVALKLAGAVNDVNVLVSVVR